MLLRLESFCGLTLIVAVSWLFSHDKKHPPWRIILWGIALQFILGVALLPGFIQSRVLTPFFQNALSILSFEKVKTNLQLHEIFFYLMRRLVDLLNNATITGAKFVFGNLATDSSYGATVAFQVLPVIILVSAISGIAYHLGIIPAVVRLIAWVMKKTLKTSGAETFATGLLIFLGIESLTAVRTYLRSMTNSELLTVMTAFMATIAGSVMVVYAGFGMEPGHLLTASLMSAPASFVISKIIRPERQSPLTSAGEKMYIERESYNLIDAAGQGAVQGLNLALSVGAMLIAFLGLVYIADVLVGVLSKPVLKILVPISGLEQNPGAYETLTLKSVLGLFFTPIAFVMGIPPTDAFKVGQLLGTKTVLNEFLAYLDLQNVKELLQPRSYLISLYALCGFANPGSLGILIAGMTGLAPERRKDIVTLGPEAFLAGTLACFMTACVVGVLLYE